VTILGGGKTAMDMVYPFQCVGFEHFSWVYRNAYLMCKMEYMFGTPSLSQIVLGVTHIVSIFVALLSSRF
jgi:hypothetical protein